MTKIEDGGPAFARSAAWGSPSNVSPSQDGMTLRDWFAGQALAGQCAYPDERTYIAATGLTVDEWRAKLRQGDAAYCYEMADAMLAARKAGVS